MSLSDEERSLIARAMAGLLAQSWSLPKALAQVADTLPEGPARRSLAEHARLLARGESSGAPEADPLMRLLITGEKAGPAALTAAAQGFELRCQARRAYGAAYRYLLVALFCLAILLTFMGFVLAPTLGRLLAFGGEIPLLTSLAIEFLSLLRFFGPLLAMAGLVLIFIKPLHRRFPTAAAFDKAALLKLYGAAVDAGLGEWQAAKLIDNEADSVFLSPLLHLDKNEAELAVRFSKTMGQGKAANLMADELAIHAERTHLLMLRFGPLLLLMAIFIVIGAVIFAVYLPIFSVAGSL
jgi:type II secretory pathway component PulF